MPDPNIVAHAGREPPPEIPESLRVPVKEPTSNAVKWKIDANEGKDAADMGRAFSIGMNLVASVGGMVAIGWALERWVWPGAKPWLILTGCLVGLAAGLWAFLRDARRLEK